MIVKFFKFLLDLFHEDFNFFGFCSRFTFCVPPGFRAFSPTTLTLLLAPLLFSLDSTARGLFEAELEADAGLTASLFAKCDSRWLLGTSCC